MLPADNPLLTSSHSLSLMGPGVSSENHSYNSCLLYTQFIQEEEDEEEDAA